MSEEDDMIYMMEEEDDEFDEFSDDLDPQSMMNHSGELSLSNSAEKKESSSQKSYEVLSEEEMNQNVQKMIQNYVGILGNPHPAIVSCLLRTYNWNGENMINEYMENPEKSLKKAHLFSLDLFCEEKEGECPICMDDFPAEGGMGLGCEHRCCLDCWQQYLESCVRDGPGCVWSSCMVPKCPAAVHEEAYARVLGGRNDSALAAFRSFLRRSYVDENGKLKWCPAPNCGFCVRTERRERREAVVCQCGLRWCFRCADASIGDHMPATCEQVELWMQKASDESENVNWMIANTKKCPKCRSPIEKNGGCMHMTCSRNAGGCGYDFCWLCRGPWSEHGSHTGGYYNCNKYGGSKAKEEDSKSTDAKTELEHYMFYYHRYESHKGALRIADQQREAAERRAQDVLERFSVRSTDVRFLEEAVEQLVINRRVLQWSYVYGFYLSLEDKPTERNLFEYLQEDVEKHTNHLSRLYEREPAKIASYQDFMDWKAEVTNYSGTCKNFLNNFVAGVQNGLIQN